jgi:hypothetical protein
MSALEHFTASEPVKDIERVGRHPEGRSSDASLKSTPILQFLTGSSDEDVTSRNHEY